MRKSLASRLRLALVFVPAVAFVTPTAASAAPPEIPDQGVGVWKMNPEKSHWPGGNAPQSETVRIEKQGPHTIRVISDTVLSDGKKTHEDSVLTYDGQERPMPGQTGLTLACELLDATTARWTERRDGKVVVELLARLSADGKIQYLQRTQFDPDGKPDSGLMIYEKQ